MSSKIRDYNKLAVDILNELGGENNIVTVARCTTRLRIVTQKTPDQAKEAIAKMPGVITVVEKGGQIQIVIGTNVEKVYNAFIQLINTDNKIAKNAQSGILNRVIATMSAVFAPFVYVLAASGILQGILILIKLFFPAFEATGTCQVFNFISWAPFAFLPIFIAITASQHFRCNIYIAVACCAALLSPTWAELAAMIKAGQEINLFGLALSETTYTSTVLPPLFLVWLLSYLERFLEPRLHSIIKPLVMPLICLVIMVPLTLVAIGPITAGAAHYIASGYNWIVNLAPSVAGGLIGAVWQVFVIFGVHWGITPVIIENINQYGRDSFQAYQTIAVIGQVGAALGFYIKTRSKDMKGVSLSAFVTGLFGITEPAIYGVNLRFKRPFIYGCISGALGGIVAGFFTPYYYTYAALPGPLTIVNAINIDHPASFIGVVIGSAIALFGPVILIQIFGTNETQQSNANIENETSDIENDTPKIVIGEINVTSPMIGKALPLSEVPDPAFSQKLMGEGIAIEPTDNHVYAPYDGEVTAVFEASKHAIGLVLDNGVELLIHVGIDTVNLTNNEFEYHVKLNQKVKKGDRLISFDPQAIKQAGYPLITPIIIVNTDQYQVITLTEKTDVNLDDNLFEIKQ
ncbi:PTS beta-glucoside transporter subunit EIIBCA [Gilliamella apicola]|uniref:glucose PTS transporter subunit IIA n=1 Tax=Gilliamella apicola TaxID=1196095 RepID=UPI000A3440D1|nr:glucose PTS transporter subunit IIA [Gilliamella apicola]OTP90263.1 PTS beta-glucoside transporter subunit EIIBCA [Gilliamella apicola]OTP93580.1 PTS beta-glucoside transporter subunit EIIBCA [Gilliamella apicola]OTP94181.1 PTS beta-glucoside transporter subunit EIIBCA [Gilliamella apicola]OTQ01864.1 PTS beta-glucoside transporter subunit EIIBCA [Gilliamella apicola]OTQ05612.1 PTS beta-glucoside transporter subunit EIIBCA [Gilliamella apicola]